MAETPNPPLSVFARVGFGLLLLASGVLPILAAFDVGPLHASDIHGPPWLAGVCGGLFLLVGVTLLAGWTNPSPGISFALMLVILAGFAALGNWIAFGPGPRQCSVGFTAFMFASTRAAAEFECRAAFGVGAVMLDGVLIWMVAGAPKRFLGAGRFVDALDKLGNATLILSLAPILLPLLLLLVGASVLGAVREYLKTHRWPRNEAMIERSKSNRKEPPR